MVERGITALAGVAEAGAAWRSLCAPTEVVGIKVYSLPGAHSGTRPAVVAGVIEGLLKAGLPATNIVVWDKRMADLRLAGYADLAARYGVRLAGSADAGYDRETAYDNPIMGNLLWGDLEFGGNLLDVSNGRGTEAASRQSGIGRKSYVSRLVSGEMDKIINITPLLNHNIAGVSGNLYGLAIGSVDNTVRFELDPGRLAEAVPEIFALPALSDKVVLNITDALVCQYEGGQKGLLHYSTMLNELWFSKDPVALDVMALRELERQRKRFGAPSRRQHMELYSNANLLELGRHNLDQVKVTRIQN
jgi:hypothetical protein